tara:strand:+ start:212 stop:856 length:645 start_codon:yes stop_codon:yes gene_type:complete
MLATDFRNASSPANAGLLLDVGSFYIDRYDGLVSQPEDLNYDDGDMNGEELAFAILGALLEEDSGSKSGGKNIGAGGGSWLAQGHISREFTNAFAVDLVIRGENADQPFVLGAYRDQLDSPGYRLVFEPGRGGEIAILLCTGNDNLELVASAWTSVDLADGRPHTIGWTRDWYGDMEVYVDGELMITVGDTYMNDWFEGVLIQSHGGNWAVDSL